MKNMKILHVFKASLPESYGGIEFFINNLCGSLSKLGVKNKVLTLSKKPSRSPLRMKGYLVYQAKQNFYIASTGFSLTAFKKFYKLAQEVDIIHYHFPNPFADLLHLICRPQKPTVLTYHSDIVKQKLLLQIYKPLMRFFLKSVNKIIATSPKYLSSSKTLQNYSNKVSIIPCSVDYKSLHDINQKKLKYWSNRLNKPFFLFVGALRYYKGLHIALEAIVGTKINLVIAGSEGIENKLKKKAKALNIDNVSFLGFVKNQDKIALLHLCYAFIFPSHLRSEAFGLSLLEAASVGKPMISCEIGTGTSYINIDNLTGKVIEPNSPIKLQEAMNFLLENPKIALKMGQNAKKRSQELFSKEIESLNYLKIYNSLLE